MATNFPSSLDSFTNPTATDTLDSPPHDQQHANINDAVEALQAKVGVNSSAVTSSLDYKVGALESRPVETKTASYTLVAADVNKRIVMNSASATTITVNTGIFSAGDTVWIHNIGAGTTTVTAGTATVNTAGSLDVGQWEGGSLYFTSASSAIFFRGGGAVNYGTATGGTSSSTITVDGDSYTLLEFTSSGTLTVSKAGVFDVLVVGGGGGGGTAGSLVCGGGGAGGYREYSKIYFDANQTVTIGAGGAVNASRGGHSRCGQPFAGGGGGTFQYGVPAFNGASGGGDGYAPDQRGNGDGVSGNDGGFSSSTGNGGGGGGGAGAVGGTGSASTGGAGGIGLDASAFRGEAATTTYYAGGGGAEGFGTRGLGGLGGGGNGKDPSNAATAGAANTGGGGGGDGAAGGSGIVLVRFKN